MTGKHFGWHKAWTRVSDSRLRHSSGLEVVIRPGAGFVDAVAADESIGAFQASEQARGVPPHDLGTRLQRLCREAVKWHERNPA